MTVKTAPQILIPPEAIQQVAAPDRWYGKDGRENRARIAALELQHEHDKQEIAVLRAAVRTLETQVTLNKQHREDSPDRSERLRKCERDVAVMEEQIGALQENCRQMQADYQ